MSRARTLADYVSSGDELADKAPKASPAFTGTPTGITAAHITSGALPVGVTGGSGLDAIKFLESNTTQDLSGTYSTGRMYVNDSYRLTGDVAVTGHFALGTLADADVVITQDSTERTITGSGTIESGRLLNRQLLTGMTGEVTANAITASGDLTVSGDIVPSTPLSHRNIIINGAMNVAQRGTSSTSASYQTVDRGMSDHGAGITITQSQETLTSDDPYDLGFRKSLKYLTTSNTTNTTSYFSSEYRVEAQDLANSGWNYTSASSYITLSFWVKISPAGTYHTMVYTQDGTKYWYAKQYTVLADTWTKVEMSVPGNSNLTITNDTGNGLTIFPFIAYGTNYTASGDSAESWIAYSSGSQTLESSDIPTWNNTTGAYVEFTGVQLELGSNATPFEHRSYGDELARCQRYYIKNPKAIYLCQYGVNAIMNIYFPVEMNHAPDMSQISGTTVSWGQQGTLSTYSYVASSSGDAHVGYIAEAEL